MELSCKENGHSLLEGVLRAPKYLLIVKCVIICLFVFSIQLQARTQPQRITLHLHNVTLLKVFEAITRQTDMHFLYTEDQLTGSRPINIDLWNAELDEALRICFAGQPLQYSIVNNTIIVSRKQTTIIPDRDTTHPVDGFVTADGKPVQGASVIIKNSSKGTTTTAAGDFHLNAVPENAFLMISLVGYQTVEIAAFSDSIKAIHLVSLPGVLDESVVIGYGTTTRRMNTGSVSKISGEEISKQPVGNVLSALAGRIAGLYIRDAKGVPGADITLQLRGINSIANSNNPFFVIDGVPFDANTQSVYLTGPTGTQTSPFNLLNPADIASIEVLKDADATAIYGSRAANGVVLITTRKGLSGQLSVDANVYSGAGDIERKLHLLNTSQYLAMRHNAFANDNALPQSYDYDVNGYWDTTRYTNWQKALIGQSAPITNAQITLSGGSEHSQYLFGGGYQKQGTVITGPWYEEKTSAHFRFTNSSVNEKLKTDFSASYSHVNNHLPQDDPAYYLFLPPDAPKTFNDDGSINWENNTWRNPFANFTESHLSRADYIRGSVDIRYALTHQLQLKVTGGWTLTQINELIETPKEWYDPGTRPFVENVSTFGDNSSTTWILEPQLNYKKNWRISSLDVLAGATIQQSDETNRSLVGTGFSNELLMEKLSAASVITNNGERELLYKYNAAFGRVGYRLMDKYIVNLTGRRDGSSRFGPDRQFANFYAAGAAWIFSSEGFMRALPFLSYGKLRASYGTTGNDGIADYGFLNTYRPTPQQYLGVTAVLPVHLANPDFAWEINRKFEIGLETGWLHDRLLASLSYYRNRSSNQLVGLALPGSTGFRNITANLPATVQNTGIEFEWTSRNVNTKNFQWTTTINGTFPGNKLINFPNIEASDYAHQYEVGKSLFIQERYHYLGVDKTTGIYQFEDVDKNGSIDYPNDLRGLKNREQTFYGGIQNSFSFRGFECSIFLQWVRQTAFNYLYSLSSPPGTMGNQFTSTLKAWNQNGDATEIEKLTQDYSSAAATAFYNKQFSDAELSNASFMRVKNISVAYNLPRSLLQKIKLQKCRLYLQGQNLFTITQYDGWDPETYGAIPSLRVLTAGIQITL